MCISPEQQKQKDEAREAALRNTNGVRTDGGRGEKRDLEEELDNE